MNDSSWSIFVVLLVLLSFILVGLRQKSRESQEYGFGGRYTGRIGGGAAIASNWMSAASLMGLAGIIYLRGYQGLAYVIGWTGGYVLLLLQCATVGERAPQRAGAKHCAAGTLDVVRVVLAQNFTSAQRCRPRTYN